MLLVLIVIHLAALVIIGGLGAYWMVDAARTLSRAWRRTKRRPGESRPIAGPGEVGATIATIAILTLFAAALQFFRHFPAYADIRRLTRTERVAGMRDYDLVRSQLDERPWYRESIAGKGLILDRNLADSLALARYRFDLVDSTFHRDYPLGPATMHLVGYATRIRGKAGIEAAFRDVLVGEGRFVDRVMNTLFAVQKVGSDVALTIDARLQRMAYDSLSAKVARGALCAMDPYTGEVLALVSVPSYTLSEVVNGASWRILGNDVLPLGADSVTIVNPARDDTLDRFAYADHPPETAIGRAIRVGQDKPLLNRAIRGTYPPGSTFKIVVAAAAYERGLDYRHDTRGSGYRPRGFHRNIRNHISRDYGIIGIPRAMEVSDNEFFASLADSLGASVIGDFAARMGVMGELRWNSDGDRMNRFQSLSIPTLAYRARDRFDVAVSGIGQGPVVTNPLRMAVAASVIASGGWRTDPAIELGRTPRRVRVISETTATRVREAMLRAVEGEEGTARAIRNDGLRIAAKTGTAQSPDDGKDHSWFVCFAPSDNPRIVIAVIGENAGWGSGVGLGIARDLLAEAKRLGYFEREIDTKLSTGEREPW